MLEGINPGLRRKPSREIKAGKKSKTFAGVFCLRRFFIFKGNRFVDDNKTISGSEREIKGKRFVNDGVF